MNKLILGLFIAVLSVVSYLGGTLYHSEAKSPYAGLHEVKCDDMVSMDNAYTGKKDLVCEVNMVNEDDNLHIFKGEGAIDD